MARKYDFISELYNRTCKTVVAHPESWEAFFYALPATTTVCVLMNSFWFTHSDRTSLPFFRSTTGTKSSGDGLIVGRNCPAL